MYFPAGNAIYQSSLEMLVFKMNSRYDELSAFNLNSAVQIVARATKVLKIKCF